MPETATGNLVRRASTKNSRNTRTIPCPACKGKRKLVDRFRRETPCVTCGGRLEERDEHGKLTVRAKLGTGRVRADTYTGQMVATEDGEVPARTVSWRCNVCDGTGLEPRRRGPNRERIRCRACDGTGRREMSPFVLHMEKPDQADPALRLERAIERRNDAGSYRELERALADLRHAWLQAARVFARVAVYRELAVEQLCREERAAWLFALQFVSGRMPDPVMVPREIVANARLEHRTVANGRGAPKQARARRNMEIREAYRQGQSVAELCAVYGLGKTAVNDIINAEARAA